MTALDIDILILCLVVIELGITLGFTIHILWMSEEYDESTESHNSFLLLALKDFIIGLFKNKNLFGIILNIPIVILLIPGVVVCLIFELIIWILVVVMTIYELGNKKE